MNCDCNQGRLACGCGKHDTPEQWTATKITLAVTAFMLAALYLTTHWMIGQ